MRPDAVHLRSTVRCRLNPHKWRNCELRQHNRSYSDPAQGSLPAISNAPKKIHIQKMYLSHHPSRAALSSSTPSLNDSVFLALSRIRSSRALLSLSFAAETRKPGQGIPRTNPLTPTSPAGQCFHRRGLSIAHSQPAVHQILAASPPSADSERAIH